MREQHPRFAERSRDDMDKGIERDKDEQQHDHRVDRFEDAVSRGCLDAVRHRLYHRLSLPSFRVTVLAVVSRIRFSTELKSPMAVV